MQEQTTWIKAVIATMGAYMSAHFGILIPLIEMLLVVVIIDYASGMIASSMTEKLSSKKGYKGILKKLSYFIAVSVAMVVDWLIFAVTEQMGISIGIQAILSCLVAIWLILNELVSILENLDRSGVKLPSFLIKIIEMLIKKVEDKGNVSTDKNGISSKTKY